MFSSNLDIAGTSAHHLDVNYNVRCLDSVLSVHSHTEKTALYLMKLSF